MDQIQLIVEFLRAMRRRAVVLVLVMALGIAGSIYYALSRPSQYEASATIQIESQQIPDDLARSTVNLTAAQRLQLIQQRLMARENLIAIINKLGLFADLPGLPIEDKLNILRGAITFTSTAAPGAPNGGGAEVFSFSITARLGNAEKAAATVNEFIDGAVAENLKVRKRRVLETLDFFDQEEQRVGASLAELEAQIAAFKRANEAALPESLEFRRDEQRRLQERDLQIDASLLELEHSRGTLTLSLVGQGPAATAIALSPEETELRRLTLQLAQRQRVLAPDHPEIRNLRSQIAAIADVIGPSAPSGATGGISEAQRTATNQQIAEIERQIELLRKQKAEIAARNTELNASISRTPEVEIALNALTRRFTDMRDQYAAISRGRVEASTGQQLEASQQSERFDVVERALVPRYPVGPNRKKLVVMGSGASVGLALGLVFLLELLNPALRTSAQMRRQLDLRPVVSIPYVTTPQSRARRRIVLSLGGGLICVGILALTLLFQQQRENVVQFAARYGLEKYIGAPETQ